MSKYDFRKNISGDTHFVPEKPGLDTRWLIPPISLKDDMIKLWCTGLRGAKVDITGQLDDQAEKEVLSNPGSYVS